MASTSTIVITSVQISMRFCNAIDSHTMTSWWLRTLLRFLVVPVAAVESRHLLVCIHTHVCFVCLWSCWTSLKSVQRQEYPQPLARIYPSPVRLSPRHSRSSKEAEDGLRKKHRCGDNESLHFDSKSLIVYKSGVISRV